jgi:hypothetical protein
VLNIDTATGGPVTVSFSFAQCVKAGLGFSLGALLLLPVIMLVAGVAGGFGAALLALLSGHR